MPRRTGNRERNLVIEDGEIALGGGQRDPEFFLQIGPAKFPASFQFAKDPILTVLRSLSEAVRCHRLGQVRLHVHG